MDYNQFFNLSCYEEFEMQCTLAGISKAVALRKIAYMIDDYYFFVSNDGIFNWFDWNGNHIEDPSILKEIKEIYIPRNITRCIVPDSVTCIGIYAFYLCDALTSITIPYSVTRIGYNAFYRCKSLKEIIFKGKTLEEVKQMQSYPFGIEDESIIKCEK